MTIDLFYLLFVINGLICCMMRLNVNLIHKCEGGGAFSSNVKLHNLE